jgi:amino acid adenylation domain-containing protein
MQVYILDAHGRPAPAGVPGELYLAGVGLGRGYHLRPDWTAERFVPNPFGRAPGERLYRTGDLARYMPDGEIEYLGRVDHQVKIRGFRVETGEIEAALRTHEGVRDAVVVAREDAPGGRSLVAYVVADADGGTKEESVSSSALRSYLKERLPPYMLPSAFVLLEALPLTPSGKVNRRALPAHGGERDAAALRSYVAPGTPVEEMLARIWGEVLKVESIGINDDFFDLGGHSLLATPLVSRVRESFGVDLPLRALFESPTVAGLARHVEAALSAGDKTQARPILPVPRGGKLPLSFAQQRLWFIHELEPSSSAYNIPIAVRFKGRLDLAAMERTLGEIVRRHESLRTTFATSDGEPVQLISPPGELRLHVLDLTHLPEGERTGEAQRLATADAAQPFELERGPLYRAGLLRLSAQDHVLLFTMHHTISDGWSISVLVNEVAALYSAFAEGRPSPLAPLPIQYADFAHWQRRYLSGEVLESHLKYWGRQLGGTLPALDLPTDRPRPSVQSFRGASQKLNLSAGLVGKLKALARREGVTLFVLLLAGFKSLLYRYTGQEDITVGSPIANRNRSEVEGLIGFFVNTLVLRTDFSGEPTFRELLGRVWAVALESYAHQDMPFEQLVERLQPERSMSRSPLFQVMFHLMNAPRDEVLLPGLTLQPVEVERVATQMDLSLDLFEGENGILVVAEYSTDLFDAATVARLLTHFQTILEGVAENPDRRIAQLPLVAGAEREQILSGWNDTARDYPSDRCLHELFEEQAAGTPDALAVTGDEERLTYAELDGRANQLARHLMALNVGPETLVAVMMDRSVALVVALLGVLKAGAGYVPLDSHYPKQRLAYMLEDSGAAVLLTQEHLLSSLPEHRAAVVVVDGADANPIASRSSLRPAPAAATSEHPAYVIYTSGSTGRPKGVVVSHRAICNRLFWGAEAFPLGVSDRVLQITTVSFDVSVWEFFAPLVAGACLVLARPEDYQDVEYLTGLIEREQVTIINVVPSLLQVLLEDESFARCRSLRQVFVGGEAMPVELPARFFKQSNAELYNLYGPTESTIDATCWKCGPQDGARRSVPIGRPVGNLRAYILDRHLEIVPVGVAGELYIGGAGLARGYLGRPELTAEKFIPNPFGRAPGERLYRTGDLARYLAEGEIEFLRRKDEQVKIRGFRIETGEIEAALMKHPSIKTAVVVVSSPERGRNFSAASGVEGNPELPEAQLAALDPARLAGILAEIEALPD